MFEDVPVKITSISVSLFPSDCKHEGDNRQRSAAKKFLKAHQQFVGRNPKKAANQQKDHK